MTYRDLFNLKDGSLFTYKGFAAKKVWGIHYKELIVKADPSAKPPTGDVFAEDYCVFFTHTGSKEGVTVVFKFADLPTAEDYQLA